jgi:Uma2 family endonuclease
MIRTTGPEALRHAFTVDDFRRMVEAGVLTEDDRVELIDGEVLEMTPIGPEHGGTVKTLIQAFRGLPSSVSLLSVQDPLLLDDRSEPEPDLMLLRPREDHYRRSHPRPGDVLLLVEVADESLERDRDLKLPRYAAAGIPELWIVDLRGRVLESCREPTADDYTTRHRCRGGDTVAPEAFPEHPIDVAAVLGDG